MHLRTNTTPLAMFLRISPFIVSHRIIKVDQQQQLLILMMCSSVVVYLSMDSYYYYLVLQH